MNDTSSQDKIELFCTVIDSFPGATFKLYAHEIDTEINATIAGKLRFNKIRILPGDEVRCEVSPYDLTRGIITWRSKGSSKK